MFLYGDGHGRRISLFVRAMHCHHDETTMRPVAFPSCTLCLTVRATRWTHGLTRETTGGSG